MGFSVLASFAFVTYAVMICVKAANVDMANMLIGGIYTLMSGLVGYYFGTSKSSADKTRADGGQGCAATAIGEQFARSTGRHRNIRSTQQPTTSVPCL